jgi:hypothetical protein
MFCGPICLALALAVSWKEPNIEPRAMTATRAMSALAIPTMTISR